MLPTKRYKKKRNKETLTEDSVYNYHRRTKTSQYRRKYFLNMTEKQMAIRLCNLRKKINLVAIC